ncbi:prepilin-type N-terminal cleavage/methylation domain-containing protein [Indiicoccus explosivorum]|uniref:prepilin-type N-terminal cleavage/methylation domain-containing protein n=1 Tax=Indiicoccus explosivorum TaxID=1917864 RepID=UPI00139049B9|nr:prepilin-type N-terminal cleavage/methylation domain-containing protein [Indiicoccus explosivorum]
MKLDERGITLVELLAALALVTLVAGIAWTLLMTGFRHTEVEVDKTVLQQDANLIITSLSNAHRRSASYTLTFEADKLKIETCKGVPLTCEVNTIDKEYNFTGTTVNGTVIDTADAVPDVFPILNPTEKHTQLLLVLTDVHNPKRTISVETTLTRILTGMK